MISYAQFTSIFISEMIGGLSFALIRAGSVRDAPAITTDYNRARVADRARSPRKIARLPRSFYRVEKSGRGGGGGREKKRFLTTSSSPRPALAFLRGRAIRELPPRPSLDPPQRRSSRKNKTIFRYATRIFWREYARRAPVVGRLAREGEGSSSQVGGRGSTNRGAVHRRRRRRLVVARCIHGKWRVCVRYFARVYVCMCVCERVHIRTMRYAEIGLLTA